MTNMKSILLKDYTILENAKKKIITVKLGYWRDDARYGYRYVEESAINLGGDTLDDIIAKIKYIKKEYADKFKNIRVGREYFNEYDSDYADYFVGDREETDEEFAKRMKFEADAQLRRDDAERKEFIRLQAKFKEHS